MTSKGGLNAPGRARAKTPAASARRRREPGEVPSVVVVLVTGSLFDGELGGGVDLEARVRDGCAALEREAVGAVRDALLCAVEGGELVAKASLDGEVQRFVLEGLSTVSVSVTGVALGRVVLGVRISRCGQQLLDAGSLGV